MDEVLSAGGEGRLSQPKVGPGWWVYLFP